MRVRTVLPHITLTFGFLVLVIASAGLTDMLELPDWVASLLAYGVAAPAALLLALRVGPIGYRGALLTSVATAALALSLAFALWTGTYAAPASTFPWSASLAIDLALIFLAPLIWLYLIRQVSSNNAFNRTPLRGAG